MLNTKITSATVRNHPAMQGCYKDFEDKCDIVVSAPGTFFLVGEKAIAHGAPAICMKIPRRVYIGLTKKKESQSTRIAFGSSIVMVQKDENLPFYVEPWSGKHDDLKNPLNAASAAYYAIVGAELETNYSLHVLSEWQGDFGLGWSGAFSVALSAALLISEGKISDFEHWALLKPSQLINDKEFDMVLRLGWCIESVIHNGRASGSAVCGSMLSTGLPFRYESSNMPQLWKVDDTNVDQLCQVPSTFRPIKEQAKYSFDYLPSRTEQNRVFGLESQISERLFTIRDIVVVHTGKPKKTGEAAKYELTLESWMNKNLDREAHYEALVNTCRTYSRAIEEIVDRALVDGTLSILDERWDHLSQLTTRVQGLLTSLGFNFVVGDELLYSMIGRLSNSAGFHSIGGKITGGGRGGDLVFVAKVADSEQLNLMQKTISSIREQYTSAHYYTPLSQSCILYSAHRDGIEPMGLVLEKMMEDNSYLKHDKIKILFLAANPTDTARLRIDEESRVIDIALQRSKFRDKFSIEKHFALRVADLQNLLLRYEPDIIHFSGHGSKKSEIILEDNSGKSKAVPVDALTKLFSAFKNHIQCVVLNACYSEEQAQAIAENINCVVGMSESIKDQSAISFSVAFYQALGFGRDVQAAFELGSIQIDLEDLQQGDIPKLLAVKCDPTKLRFVHE